MENNTLNKNASGDCGGKDAKTASFVGENEFQKSWPEGTAGGRSEFRRPIRNYASICCASRSRLKATRRSSATAAK